MRFITTFIFRIVLILLFPLSAQAAYFFGYPIYPYIGADYQLRETPFRERHGGGVFESQFQQGQIFLGVRFWEYLGIELTYSKTNIKNRFSQIGENGHALGVFVPPAGPTETHLSQAEYRVYSANLMGFYLIPFDPLCRTELIGSFGIAQVKPKLKDELTHLDNVALTTPLVYTFNKRRSVLRLMAGIQYKLTPNIGVRGTFTFEDTSQFEHLKANEFYDSHRVVSLKNSLIYGLGFFFNTSER